MKRRPLGIRQPGEAAKSRRKAFAALVVATALVAASCGSGSEATTDAGSGGTEASGAGTEAAVAEASFPDTEVLSLNDGATVKFDELVAGGDTPVLLWFYFPH